MYVRTCTYAYVHLYVYVHTYIHTCIYIRTYMCNIHIPKCQNTNTTACCTVHTYICICVYTYVYAYIHTYLCMCSCICIHMHSTWSTYICVFHNTLQYLHNTGSHMDFLLFKSIHVNLICACVQIDEALVGTYVSLFYASASVENMSTL